MHNNQASGNGGGEDAFEVSGTVKWFDPVKGYGFLVPDQGGPDVLLHSSCLKQSGFDAVFEGTRVKVLAVQTQRGLQAHKVLEVDNSPREPRRPSPSPMAAAPASRSSRSVNG